MCLPAVMHVVLLLMHYVPMLLCCFSPLLVQHSTVIPRLTWGHTPAHSHFQAFLTIFSSKYCLRSLSPRLSWLLPMGRTLIPMIPSNHPRLHLICILSLSPECLCICTLSHPVFCRPLRVFALNAAKSRMRAQTARRHARSATTLGLAFAA